MRKGGKKLNIVQVLVDRAYIFAYIHCRREHIYRIHCENIPHSQQHERTQLSDNSVDSHENIFVSMFEFTIHDDTIPSQILSIICGSFSLFSYFALLCRPSTEKRRKKLSSQRRRFRCRYESHKFHFVHNMRENCIDSLLKISSYTSFLHLI